LMAGYSGRGTWPNNPTFSTPWWTMAQLMVLLRLLPDLTHVRH